MSATGRGAARRADDFYATPAWCVHRLLDRLQLPNGEWLEPCVGDGSIVRASFVSPKRKWTTLDIRFVEADYCADFLQLEKWQHFDVVITNPPFSLALEFVKKARTMADHVVMLLRLNFLESDDRAEFFRNDMPDVYVLPNRPSFTEDGKTDATAYGWFHWWSKTRLQTGRVEVLAPTLLSERKKTQTSETEVQS